MKSTTRNGQVMLLTITVLSAGILGATSVAGILMLYQIRQANDILNSTKAIYAADAGIEYGLYCANPKTSANCPQSTGLTLYNGASVSINPLPSYSSQPTIITAIGTSARVQRAFENVITPAGQ